MNEQSHLPVQFGGDGGQGTGGFPADNLLNRAFFLGQPFQCLELFGLQPAGIAGNSCDRTKLLKKETSAGRVARGTGKGNDVADIGHTGNKLHQPLKTKAKTRVRH